LGFHRVAGFGCRSYVFTMYGPTNLVRCGTNGKKALLWGRKSECRNPKSETNSNDWKWQNWSCLALGASLVLGFWRLELPTKFGDLRFDVPRRLPFSLYFQALSDSLLGEDQMAPGMSFCGGLANAPRGGTLPLFHCLAVTMRMAPWRRRSSITSPGSPRRRAANGWRTAPGPSLQSPRRHQQDRV
jgi:hypothetical protein